MDDWKKIVKEKFGFGPEHLNISYSTWLWELWDKSYYPELKNNNQLLVKLDKLHQDFAESPKQSEGPILQQFITDKLHYTAFKGQNILTNLGMAEMAQRSTGESPSTNTHHGIGTGTTTETISDTTLQTEVGRKIIGTRNTVNQTERYGTAFDSDDLGSPPEDISEAGIFTALTSGILIMRITATPVTLDTGKILTIQTNISHQNGTEV